MNITETIAVLEEYREKYGDLPVMIQSGDEETDFPYYEVESTDVFLDKEVTEENDTRDGEILSFVALSYW